MNTDDKLSEVFNVEPMDKTEVIKSDGTVLPPKSKKQEENIDFDYNRTRDNLHGLLVNGQDALVNALEIAKQSEHPRAFEVVGNLIKQLADVNEQLLNLHERKQKLDSPGGKEDKKGVTNNNAIFVGSTSELNKLLNDLDNKGD